MRQADLNASPPMFRSPWLDRFTRVHPLVPLVLFLPAICALLARGAMRLGLATALGLALAGYVAWTLTEYWLHRLVFHYRARSALGQRLHWMIHGVHHAHPNDRLRLVLPPATSIPLALAFWVPFRLALGTDAAMATFGGYLGGYLLYDMIHYAVHHHRPRTAAGRKLRELHLRHHFQDDRRGFGVSAPYWDHVFGTALPQRRLQSAGH